MVEKAKPTFDEVRNDRSAKLTIGNRIARYVDAISKITRDLFPRQLVLKKMKYTIGDDLLRGRENFTEIEDGIDVQQRCTIDELRIVFLRQQMHTAMLKELKNLIGSDAVSEVPETDLNSFYIEVEELYAAQLAASRLLSKIF